MLSSKARTYVYIATLLVVVVTIIWFQLDETAPIKVPFASAMAVLALGLADRTIAMARRGTIDVFGTQANSFDKSDSPTAFYFVVFAQLVLFMGLFGTMILILLN